MKINVVWYYLIILLSPVDCVSRGRYVVYSDQCRIPEPNSTKINEFYKISYESCTSLRPITRVDYNSHTKHYVLSINESIFKWYIKIDLELAIQPQVSLSCCYMQVKRLNEYRVDLNENCTFITNGGELPDTTDGFIVQCYANEKLIYTNAHATVPERKEVRERLNQWANDRKEAAKRATSVLIIGIDTISRLNLKRAMPETEKYLQEKAWFEMQGYNKIGDNTIPNVVSMTAGLNMDSLKHECNPYTVGGLDRCQFIWKDFEEHGYVTAFGEDDTPINTFNYSPHQGFKDPPVDYYLRPYLMAAENYLDRSEQKEQYCLGYQHASEHVYNYALEFAHRYRNDSFFGFFWTNTHSHGGSISRTSTMDSYIKTLLERLVRQGTMEQSVVILVSDHGLRFGPARASRLGWLEERLPLLYIWLPSHLKQSHPEFVLALKQNRNRLTSPFDLYMTLKHILMLSTPGRLLQYISDCPYCQSLLEQVPANRTCYDAGIAEHWCTCWSYKIYQVYTVTDYKMGQEILIYVKRIYKELKPETSFTIYRAYVAIRNKSDDPHVSIHRLQLKVFPLVDLFEGTVKYNSTSGEIVVTGLTTLLEYDSI